MKAQEWLNKGGDKIRPTPKASSRTRRQIVTLAEDTWLMAHIVPTDTYIDSLEVGR